MIEYIRTKRHISVVERTEESIASIRQARAQGNEAGIATERLKLLETANSLERSLGDWAFFDWKPPMRAPGDTIPRPIVGTYLQELWEDPYSDWVIRLEALLNDVLARLLPDYRQHAQRSLALAFFPLYWPFGIAGLIVESFGTVLVASGLVSEQTVLRHLTSSLGKGAQILVTILELWTFYRLFVNGQLF